MATLKDRMMLDIESMSKDDRVKKVRKRVMNLPKKDLVDLMIQMKIDERIKNGTTIEVSPGLYKNVG